MANINYVAGIDVGTSFIKVAILDNENCLIGSCIQRSSAELQQAINKGFRTAVDKAKISADAVRSCVATGFGRRTVGIADMVKTEISCHAKCVHFYFPKKATIIDIGGQDTKIIKIDEQGKILSFKMNRKCAAGTGAFLEEIARRLDIQVDMMNQLASKSNKETPLSSFCTVFASTEILSRIKEGENIEDMAMSAFESVVRRVIEMDTLDGLVVGTGGVIEHNNVIKKILANHIGKPIETPPNPQLAGAIGAALFA